MTALLLITSHHTTIDYVRLRPINVFYYASVFVYVCACAGVSDKYGVMQVRMQVRMKHK
jgi:hypothetical protein